MTTTDTGTTDTPDTLPEARPAGWRPEPSPPSRVAFAPWHLGDAGDRPARRMAPLVVIAAVAVMIFMHELGHFLTAKWAGMKVTEFFLGFGPKIWSFQRGETEYGIKAIPAVAYVRIVGMHNLEEVDPADETRTYRQKPYWRRLSVAVAGSTMHFLMALVCIFLVLVFHGRPGGLSLFPTEAQVRACRGVDRHALRLDHRRVTRRPGGQGGAPHGRPPRVLRRRARRRTSSQLRDLVAPAQGRRPCPWWSSATASELTIR